MLKAREYLSTLEMYLDTFQVCWKLLLHYKFDDNFPIEYAN